jgi:hypothetical protein
VPAEALDAFGACVALAPEVAACRYNRGLAYAGLGEVGRARQDLAEARRVDPTLRGAAGPVSPAGRSAPAPAAGG